MVFVFSLLCTLFIFSVTSATVLSPIPDPVRLFPHLLRPRQHLGPEVYNPQNRSTFFWSDGYAFLANFTFLTPGAHEAILPIKDFADRLKSIRCNNATNTITLEFQYQECFDHTYRVWDWVNQHVNHTFTLITEAGQCDSDDVRDPYQVSTASFDQEGLKVTLAATRQTWAEAAHSFRLLTSRVDDGSNGTAEPSPAYPFFDDKMKELFAGAHEIQNKLAAANGTETSAIQHLIAAEEAMTNVINATAQKALDVLDQLVQRYGGTVKEVVDATKAEYAELDAQATQKEKEALGLMSSDPARAWTTFEDALELEQDAARTLENAFAAVYTALGKTPPGLPAQTRDLHIRGLHKRFNLFRAILDGLKHIGETIINGVANLLGANKPLTLDLTSDFTPQLFDADKSTSQYGMDMTVGAELKTGGTITSEVEVHVDFGAASVLRATVQPKGIFASATLNVTADGQLKKSLQWQPVGYDIPLPHASFEIPFLIKVGPFVALSLRSSLEELAGNATLGVGAKATVSDKAIIRVDLLHRNETRVSGWTPHFERIGPDFTAELEGRAALWMSTALKLEASILGGKIGAKAEVELQAPRLDARFNVSTSGGSNATGICGANYTSGISFEADVGVDLNLNAGLIGMPNMALNGGAPEFKIDLFSTSWPMFSTCAPLHPTSTYVLPIASAGHSISGPGDAGYAIVNMTASQAASATGHVFTPGAIYAYPGALPTSSNGTADQPTEQAYYSTNDNYNPVLHPIATPPPSPLEHGSAEATAGYGTMDAGAYAGPEGSCPPSNQLFDPICTTKTWTVVQCGPTVTILEQAPTVTIMQHAQTVTVMQNGPLVTVTQDA